MSLLSHILIMTLIESAGYVPPGNKYKDLATIHLQVVSDLVSSRLLIRAGNAQKKTSARAACAAAQSSSHMHSAPLYLDCVHGPDLPLNTS